MPIYSLEYGHTPGSQSPQVKLNPSPHIPARSHQQCKLHLFHHPYHNFQMVLSMAFCLDCYFCFRRWGGVGVITKAFHVPPSQLWICSHLSLWESSFLAPSSQQEHRSWTAHGLWCQHEPWTSAWFPVWAEQTTEINTALCHSMDHGHCHSSQQNLSSSTSTWPWVTARSWTSSWPSVVTWAMDILI